MPTEVKFFSGPTLLVMKPMNIPLGTHGFSKVSGSYVTPWACDKVVFKITFRAASGTAWFAVAALSWFP